MAGKAHDTALYCKKKLGKTVERPRRHPGKTVPREFPWDMFSRLPRLFHSVSDFGNPIGQSGTFETLTRLKQKPKLAFRLSLGNNMKKLSV